MKRFLLLVPFFSFLLLLPLSADAVSVGLPFGGYIPVSVPCTCSIGTWIYYTPLFLGTGAPSTGALYLPPGALLFQFFQPGTPTTWDLGSYVPDAGEECWVVAPNPVDPCIMLPALGTIEYMGTSVPGGSPTGNLGL